ncbi:OLC1v1035209C1 [Oldenlandia corymbosa var. corymbosa]|uniref:OLC1v1035209C1 n=1 Tax=Oldenlandia corymbosa var. corymbosa TaxID=529605 RepID=A0AAV1CTN1_OLDCO|nr:OLC1v1035209C1 [Oldenlandia corymbosa var. corymbosa]
MAFSAFKFLWSLLLLMMNLSDPPSSSSSSGSSSSSSNNWIPDFSTPVLPPPPFPSAVDELAEHEDLLWEIFLLLPVKTLIRFKSVSKKWNRIISDHKFGIRHTRQTPNPNPTSLVMIRNKYIALLPLQDDHRNRLQRLRFPALNYFSPPNSDISLRTITICNGLVLGFLSSVFSPRRNAYCVTNIATRKFLRLPPPIQITGSQILGITLAFDPSKSPNFTVLCIGRTNSLPISPVKMEIYSSETGEWKVWEGKIINTRHAVKVFTRGVLWNNTINWLTPIGNSFYFSLADETMRVLPMPPECSDGMYICRRMMFLGESRGFLHLLDLEIDISSNPPIHVYQMKENHKGWVLKNRVSLDHIARIFPGMTGQIPLAVVDSTGSDSDGADHLFDYFTYSVLTVIWAEDGESFDLILMIPSQIIAYNTKSDTVRVILRFQDNVPMTNFKGYEVHHFNDTLAPIPTPTPTPVELEN